MHKCGYCGGEVKNSRAKTCGSEDCKRAYNRERCRAWQAANRERANEIARKYKASDKGKEAARKYVQGRKTERECVWCGRRFLSIKARYCSPLCKSTSTTKQWWCRVPDRRPVVYRPVEDSVREKPPRRFVGGRCARCGVSFLVESYVAALYCSRRCAKAESKARRRALERTSSHGRVRRDLVFARDGFKCALCGGPLDMDAAAPEPMAPTIDHVVPLSRGGQHSMSNVQSAHFLCNSIKSDRC